MDTLCMVSDIVPTVSNNCSEYQAFANSYFYRAHLEWNKLPLELRLIAYADIFKTRLIEHLWKELASMGDGDE